MKRIAVTQPLFLLQCFIVALSSWVLPSLPAHAEGSLQLVYDTDTSSYRAGRRPYLEFLPGFPLAGIPFSTTVKVYAQSGETLNLGSSAVNIGVDGDIIVRPPSGAATSCKTAQPGTGLIDSLAKELAGPFHVTENNNANAYTPCVIDVNQTGVWEIDFVSPDSDNIANPPNTATNAAWSQPTNAPYVAAWDVTVRNSSGVAIPGRAFTNSLALNTGGNSRPIESEVFVQTRDGYRYRVDLNGLDPAGFIFFANNKGFLEAASGNPLYRSVALGTGFSLPPGVDLHLPTTDDNPSTGDFTYQVFFNPPDTAVLNDTLDTDDIANFRFEGAEANTPGQAGTSPLGGSFKFIPPGPGNAIISIDANGDDDFNDPEDVELTQYVPGGVEAEIFWNGRDGLGNVVPPRTAPYRAQLQFTFGEVHFPLIDPENSNGIIIERLNPSSDFTIYYNDDDPNSTTPGPIDNNQIDSRTGTHSFTGFGNNTGIDRWSFYTPPPLELLGGITIAAADLEITKVATPNPAIAGGNITYTITVTNQGPSNLTTSSPATVTDTLPAEITNISWSCAIATGNGTCVDASGTGNLSDVRLALDAGSSATYTLTGAVSPDVTPDESIDNTATVTRPDDVADPDDDDGTNDEINFTETATESVTVNAGTPQLGVSKQATNVVNNGDGTYTVSYTVTVQNSGNLPVNNLQVTEDLFGTANSTFAGTSPAPTIASAPQIVSGNLTATNANFNGNGDKNLLAGTETLAVGESAAIAFSVVVTPGSNFGPYNNNATASGTTPGGTPVSDVSTDGTDPDPDGDGDPTNNSEATPVSFSETPVVGVAKQAGTPTNNGDGTFTIPYTLTVENLGNVALSNLQVVENLNQTFAGASAYTVDSISSSDLTVNNSFNGNSDTNLLASGNTLPVGQTATLTLQVTVTPGNNLGPYDNTASASGTSPGGTSVSDDSNNSTDPDPDGNGDPSDNDTPTTISFSETPVVGVAKEAGTPTDNGDRTFTIPYTVVVENLGDVPLSDLQVVENLNQTFGSLPFTVSAIASSDLSVNNSFNGNTDTNLLASGNTLPVGTTARITFNVRLTPGNNFGPYNNSVSASGSSPGGTSVSDNSTNGTNPDPDGNGNPNDDSTPTPVTLIGTPNFQLEKRITRINGTTFNEVDNLPNWPNNFVQGRTNADVLPGDEVEYTIYFLSNGSAAANNAIVCDPLQDAQQFILNAFNGQTPTDGGFATNIGIALALNSSTPTVYLSSPNDPPDRGQFYPPQTATPPACQLPNVRGAVVVELGSLAPGDYGFIRFRVQVD